MSKQVVAKEANELAVQNLNEWGEAPVLNAQDIIIPKILPMQPSSELVTDAKASIGEFRDSLTSAKIGSIAEPFEIIPFHMDKVWDINEEDEDGNFKWVRTEPLIEDATKPGYNDNLPWQDTENGVAVKRIRRMNFYVMLPGEIAGGGATPYVISFKSTSFKAGKQMYTQMYMRNRAANLAPCAYTFKVGGEKQKNEKGTFIVPSVELGRKSTAEENAACLTWFKTIKKGGVKVDESDLKDAASVAADVEMTGPGAF